MKKICSYIIVLIALFAAVSSFSLTNWTKVNENMSVMNTQYSSVYKAKISDDGKEIVFFTNSGYLVKIDTETGQEISKTFIVTDFSAVDFTSDGEYVVYVDKYDPQIKLDSNVATIINLTTNSKKSITYYTDRGLLRIFKSNSDKVYISENKDYFFTTWNNAIINNYSLTGTDKYIGFCYFDLDGNILKINNYLNQFTELYDVSSKKGLPGFIFSGIKSSTILVAYTRTTDIYSSVNSLKSSGLIQLHYSGYHYWEDGTIGKSGTRVDPDHKYFSQIHRKDTSVYNCYFKDKDSNKYFGINESQIDNSKNIDLDLVGWNYFDDNGYTLKQQGANLSISTIRFDKKIMLTPKIYPFSYTVNCNFAYKDNVFLFCSDGYLRVINNGNFSDPYCGIIASNKNPRVGETVNFEAAYSSHFTDLYFSMDGFGQNTQKVSHAFSKEGKYIVKLVCKNDSIEISSQIVINVLSNLIPDFEIVGGNEQFVKDTISFVNKSQGSNYNSSFSSEGATVVSQSPYRIYYNNPGMKTIKLTIFDNYGSKSISKDVNIKIKPNGIKDNNIFNSFFYPNPANEELIFNNNLNCKFLTITDLYGNEVINLENVSELKSLNISKISIGIYFLTIINNNETKTFKFIKIE
jgi:hypothetical protein